MYTSFQNNFELPSVSHLPSSETSINHCMNSYEQNDSIDYSRRPSYFTGLLTNSSESSFSDSEQQTPSPFNGYEDYQYQHPLESGKRRQSVLTDLPNLNNTGFQAPADIRYSTVVNPWLTAVGSNNNNPSPALNSRSVSPMMYANPSVDMYSPQAYQQSMISQPFENFNSFSSCAPLASGMTTMSDGIYRERASSSSSDSSDSSLSCNNDSSPNNRTNKAAPSKGPLKQVRSRGRRVSNSPSIAGQKVFKCHHDDCGKVFKRSEHLKRHIRSIHTMEKRKCFVSIDFKIHPTN